MGCRIGPICLFACLFLAPGTILALEPPQESTQNELVLNETRLRIHVADEMCKELPLIFTEEFKKERKTIPARNPNTAEVRTVITSRIIERPVALCARSIVDGSWHIIELRIPTPLPEPCTNYLDTARENRMRYPGRVVTPGYRIAHVSGCGIARLSFDVWKGDDKLLVYRMMHAWIPPEVVKRGNKPEEVKRHASVITYTPYHPDLHDQILVMEGKRFLREEIRSAMAELRLVKAESRAYKGKLIPDVVTETHLATLAAIEQMDHDKFRADPMRTLEATLVEYALNGRDAFRFSISSADAVGAYQFTNTPRLDSRTRRTLLGTYARVVLGCPRARLIHDFGRGVTDLRNIIKAASCLFDMDLADLPKPVRDLYAMDPRVGGIYPVAAYNEGKGGATELYQRIKSSGIDLAAMGATELDLPESVFRRTRECNACPKKQKLKEVMNGETAMYIKKYIFAWEYFEE